MLFLPPSNDLLNKVDSGQRRLSISAGSVSTATSSALTPIPIPNNNSANISNNNGNNEKPAKTISIPTIIDAPPPDWSSKISSIFSFVKKKSNYELEIDALRDSMIFIRPISGEEGILVHRLDKTKKYIHSLQELDIGYIYLTERDTPIIRQNQHEVTFANKIIIQCKSYKKFSIKGILQNDVTTTALEAFTKRKMTQGMLFIEEDGQLCRIFYRISDLVLNTIYANHDDTVMLQRLPNNEVRFLFEGQHSKDEIDVAIQQYANPSTPKDWKRINVLREQQHHSSQAPLASDNIATRFLNKFQTKSKMESSQLKQKRENTINKLKSRMRIDWEWKNPSEPTAPNGATNSTGATEENKTTINNIISRFKGRMSIKTNNNGAPIINTIKENANNNANTSATSSTNTTDNSTSTPATEEAAPNIPAPPPPPAPPAPPAPPPPPKVGGASNALKFKKQIKEKKMRQLHWSVIPKDKLKESFWDSLSPVKSNDRDQSLVEQWFSLSPPPKQTVSREKSSKSLVAPVVTILDLRRANNACILLSQFKLSFGDIKEAILTYDETKLSIEQLIALDAMLPITEEEVTKLSAYKGDVSSLGVAERFFIEMMAIDRLKQRIQTFLFRAEVVQMMRELAENLQCIATAAEQVKSSSRFRQMLKVILHVGSILNRGQSYLHGKGFRLDSLSKLAETKSRDEKHTVIDFIQKYVRENKPELLTFYDDLSLLDGSCISLSLDILLEDVEHINSKFKQVLQEISADDVDPNYRTLMQPFYDTQYDNFMKLQDLSTSTMKQFNECCTFFGEDTSISSKDFFNNIFNFSQKFKKSVIANDQQISREKQLKEKQQRQKEKLLLKLQQQQQKEEEEQQQKEEEQQQEVELQEEQQKDVEQLNQQQTVEVVEVVEETDENIINN